jgi:amino acid transporter
MAEKLVQIDRRVLYASLVLIMVIGLLLFNTEEQVVSAMMLFLLILIAISNIAYIYTRYKKK